MKNFYGDKQKRYQTSFSLKRILFIAGLMLFVTSGMLAHNVTISGKVIDTQTKKVMPFVNVVVKSTNSGAVTNSKGI